MPAGSRDLGVAALRYQAQLSAYVLLLTWRYPDSSPVLVGRAEPGRRAAAEPGGGRVTRPRRRRRGARRRLGRRRLAPRRHRRPGRPRAAAGRRRRGVRRELVDEAGAVRALPARRLGRSPQVVALVTLAVYARYGARYARESAAGPIGTGMLLGMLGLAIVWLAQLPFALAAVWWERRHDVSEVGYLECGLRRLARARADVRRVCIALLVVMALARRLGSWWWIPGAAVFTADRGAARLRRPVPHSRAREAGRSASSCGPTSASSGRRASTTSRSGSRR